MPVKTATPQKPLSKAHEKFVDVMVHDGDKVKASVAAGYNQSGWKRLLENKRILAEIERRKGLVEAEVAKLTAKKRVVNIEALDQALMAVVRVDVKKIPQLGPSKVRAIELGYERVGILVDGTFIPDSPTTTTASPDEAPRIFRATEARILTHTIETRQEVTRREVSAPPPPPAAKTLEGERSPFNF
jgi:hypothetical protein